MWPRSEIAGKRSSIFAASVVAAALIAGALVVSVLVLRSSGDHALLCSLSAAVSSSSSSSSSYSRAAPADELAAALLHYATTSVVPQQSRAEISLSFAVLRRRAPCNFLVFGLGHDSVMWNALNPGGRTLFLEEDPRWFGTVTRAQPRLRASTVRYRTRLSEADDLLRSYRREPACRPGAAAEAGLRRSGRCRLALAGEVPAEVHDREWDVIMIDAPKGYFPAAPGRMAAIFSAAVMARRRRGPGETDVFLHDVNRPVEKAFASEFLCEKHRVGGTGRLWHFRIPPAKSNNGSDDAGDGAWSFC